MFFNDTAPTEIYTLSLHDALPIWEIREYADWSDFQIRTHIKELEDMEYIYSVAGKHGREYVYELVYTGGGEDGNRFLIGLIPIEELRKKAKKEGLPVD